MNNMMNKISKFQCFYFMCDFGLAIYFPYIAIYLNTQKMSSYTIGLLMSLMGLAGIIGQVLLGYICDYTGKIKKICIISFGGLFIPVILLFNSSNTVMIGIMVCIVGFFHFSIFGLMDSWVLESGDEIKYNFGKIRALGSMGWAISAIFIGKLADKIGMGLLSYIFLLVGSITVIVMTRIAEIHKRNSSDKEKITLVKVVRVFKNKKFIILNIIFLLIYSILNGSTLFSTLLIQDIGGSKYKVGLFYFVMAISEVPAFFFAKNIVRKVKYEMLLIMSSGFLIIRMILVAYSLTVNQIITTTILQMLTFSLFTIATKYLIDNISESDVKTTSQMLSIAIYQGLGGAIAPVICGYLTQKFGLHNMLMILSIISFITLIFSIVYYIATKNSKVRDSILNKNKIIS